MVIKMWIRGQESSIGIRAVKGAVRVSLAIVVPRSFQDLS